RTRTTRRVSACPRTRRSPERHERAEREVAPDPPAPRYRRVRTRCFGATARLQGRERGELLRILRDEEWRRCRSTLRDVPVHARARDVRSRVASTSLRRLRVPRRDLSLEAHQVVFAFV